MFRVVTVGREYASGGAAIAKKVAEALGWRLWDRRLIEAVARQAQVDPHTALKYDESVDSWWYRINRGGIWSLAVAGGISPADARLFDCETVAALAQDVILKAASKGNCVIVGRGGECVLRDFPGVLHVFIRGSWPGRVARVRERLGEHCHPAELIRSADRTRAAYIRRYFGRDWKDPHLYHLMISSQLGIEEAASMIIGAVRGSERVAGPYVETETRLAG